MTKADFVWTVGYQGNTAIINKKMKGSVRSLDPEELLAQGHIRPAFCAAIWDAQGNASAMDGFVASFNRASGLAMTLDDLKRLVGVYALPEGTIKTLAV